MRYAPVGFLDSCQIDLEDKNALIDAEDMLKPYGLTPGYACMQIQGHPGYKGVSVSVGVCVENIDKVIDIPGFRQIGSFTGPHWTLEGYEDLLMVRGNSLTTKIKRPEKAPLPQYDKDGVFAFNMITLGQMGSVIYLKEDPEHVYISATFMQPREAIASARAMLESEADRREF